VGSLKAKVVADLMVEMNPDVKGTFTKMSPSHFIDFNAKALRECQLVIACELSNSDVVKLGEVIGAHNVPLCHLRQYGQLGYIRLYKHQNDLIESRNSENPFTKRDLRMANPWPELLQYANSFDLHTKDEAVRSHMPYVVILIQLLNKWRQDHGGAVPKTYEEKQDFKKEIRKLD
jgi:NEDD8-activating enzyme E1 regulatory subunit